MWVPVCPLWSLIVTALLWVRMSGLFVSIHLLCYYSLSNPSECRHINEKNPSSSLVTKCSSSNKMQYLTTLGKKVCTFHITVNLWICPPFSLWCFNSQRSDHLYVIQENWICILTSGTSRIGFLLKDKKKHSLCYIIFTYFVFKDDHNWVLAWKYIHNYEGHTSFLETCEGCDVYL